jgi:hypothetical protein
MPRAFWNQRSNFYFLNGPPQRAIWFASVPGAIQGSRLSPPCKIKASPV